jgi:hypothetical protein
MADRPDDPEAPAPSDLDPDDLPTDTALCPECGCEIYDDAVQCPHCRQYLPSKWSVRRAGRAGSRWPWYAAVAALIAALVLYCVLT